MTPGFRTLAAGLVAAPVAGGASAATLAATRNTVATGTIFAPFDTGAALTIDFTEIDDAIVGARTNVLDPFDDDRGGTFDVNEIAAFSGTEVRDSPGDALSLRDSVRFIPTIAGFTNGTRSAVGDV